ncbi:MAG: hypothetical protein MUF71_12150 [Candidatus Kapabacteria bacterium]|nr:hypothetical protein [Candidatus Kapabacteria bacterium]
MKTSSLPQWTQYLFPLCCVVFVSLNILNAQDTVTPLSSTSQGITYPRSMGGYFFELGSVSHHAHNANFNRWNFITVGSMQATGLSIHQGFLWNFMPSAENNVIVRVGWNTDFASFRESQSATMEQLPWYLQNQLPNRSVETNARSIRVEHDISMTLMHLTLSASYRHRIISKIYLELGAESSAMFDSRFYLRQQYDIRNGGTVEAEGSLYNTVTSGNCPKTQPVPLENVSIPIMLLGGVGAHVNDLVYFYARYYHPLTPLIPQFSWRTERFTVGVELHLSE